MPKFRNYTIIFIISIFSEVTCIEFLIISLSLHITVHRTEHPSEGGSCSLTRGT